MEKKRYLKEWQKVAYGVGDLFSIVFIVVGYIENLPLMLLVSALRGLGMSPMIGTLNAVIADISTYTYKKDKVHLDGTMFSCSSMGIKLGGGIGY